MRTTPTVAWLGALLMAVGPFQGARAQVADDYGLDCTGLKLTAASGVALQPNHRYEFNGSCDVLLRSGSSSTIVRSFPVVAVANWDGAKQELFEKFTILGGFSLIAVNAKQQTLSLFVSGSVWSRFTCATDPLISRTACAGAGHGNDTRLPAFSEAYQRGRPMLSGRTTLAEAAALSPLVVGPQSGANQTAAAPAPAPPAPGPLPLNAGTAVPLADGTTLRARNLGGGLRWVVEDPAGKVLRVFPAGATAATDRQGMVRVLFGRQATEIGRVLTRRGS